MMTSNQGLLQQMLVRLPDLPAAQCKVVHVILADPQGAARATVERVNADEARAEAVLRQARQDFQRSTELLAGKIASQADFDKAEVTGGGVSTAELNSTTMEARRVPGLFFIGEVVDVTGHLGGYNFQWAWASAHAAAEAITASAA